MFFSPFSTTDSYFIAYNSSTGAVTFNRIPELTAEFKILFEGTWASGWSHLMPCASGFIAYNSSSGEATFNRIRADGAGSDILSKGKWAPNWSHLMPFQFGSSGSGYIAYNSSTGAVTVNSVRADGLGADFLFGGTWATGWSHFMPYQTVYDDDSLFDSFDTNRFIAYNSTTGAATVNRIQNGGAGFDILWKGAWDPGWSHFMPFRYGSSGSPVAYPFFVAYNSTTGKVNFCQLFDPFEFKLL